MNTNNIKKAFAIFCLTFVTSLCIASGIMIADHHSDIQIKQTSVQGAPKTSSIQASIDGHWLSVVFLENLGQVYIEISEVGGGEAQSQSTPTPNGVDFYITYTGSYIVTFTLPNGDEYYGEFEVRDE